MKELLGVNPTPSIYAACAGAGMSVMGALFKTCGASRYLVGATYPYAREETDRFIGFAPEKYTSKDTAVDLAIASYLRAAPHGENPVGLGISATIAGAEIHRGDHVIHAVAIGRDHAAYNLLNLDKEVGEDFRAYDDVCATYEGIDAICGALGVCEWGHLSEEEILARVMERPVFHRDGHRETGIGIDAPNTVLLSGNFNPIHVGHKMMAAKIATITGKTVAYEMCVTPPHKARIPAAEALLRVARADRSVVLSEAPLYLDKARKWPGAGFIVGADALARMLDPQWGPAVDKMLEEFLLLGTRFYVFGRTIDGAFVSAYDVCRSLSRRYDPLFRTYDGQWDVSSTKLRGGA